MTEKEHYQRYTDKCIFSLSHTTVLFCVNKYTEVLEMELGLQTTFVLFLYLVVGAHATVDVKL